MRAAMITALSVSLLAACGGGEPTVPMPAEVVPSPGPGPATTPEPTPAPAAEQRIGTINLSCGGESFRVAFLDTHAAIVSADASTTVELPVLAAGPTTEPGVTLYTDGKQTFAKSGGGDTPTVIRYAKGRMAFQECAIAQN